MKMASSSQTGQPAFVHDHSIECLWRHTPTNKFYAILKRGGHQIKRSLKTRDREMARRRLEHLRQKVSQLANADGGSVMFSEIAKRWLEVVGVGIKASTLDRYQRTVDLLKPHFKKPARNITRADCERWAIVRSKDSAARTYNHDMQVLQRVLSLAERDGMIMENPARVVHRRKQPKPPLVIPTKEQQGWKGLKLIPAAGRSSEMASEPSETTGDASIPEASEGCFPLGGAKKTPGLEETTY